MNTPALLTRVSMRPNRSSAAPTMRPAVAGSVRSAAMVSTPGSSEGLIVRAVATFPSMISGGDTGGPPAPVALILVPCSCRLPAWISDGLGRCQDEVGHRLRLRDHDHVRALDLDDAGARPPGHRTDDVGTGGLVAGGDHRPGRQPLPGGRSGRVG